jgi:hypothetical protein
VGTPLSLGEATLGEPPPLSWWGQRYVPGSWHGCGFRFRAAIEENHMEQALGAFEKVGRDQELSRDQELI